MSDKNNNNVRRILLISHIFPPLSSAGSLRPAQWAKFWDLNNVEVTVLTSKKYFFDGKCDLLIKLSDSITVVEVEYMPQLFLSNYSVNRYTKSGSVNLYLHTVFYNVWRILKNTVASVLRKYLGSLLDVHYLWRKNAIITGDKILQKGNYDAIVSSYSPPVVHQVASKLKILHPSVIWIADYRDLWVNNIVTMPKWPFNILENRMERKSVGRYADSIITVSEPLADDLGCRMSQPVFVIPNGFDPTEYNSSKVQSKNKKITLVHTGTISDILQNHEPLFKAIHNMSNKGIITKEMFEINFYGSGSVYDTLGGLIKKYKIENFIVDCGHINREKSLEAQRNSDALLLFEIDENTSPGAMTSKIFEYIISGRPIMGIGSKTHSITGDLIKKTGTGVSCKSDIECIELCILGLIYSNNDIFNYSPDLSIINKFSRNEQANKVLKIISKINSNIY